MIQSQNLMTRIELKRGLALERTVVYSKNRQVQSWYLITMRVSRVISICTLLLDYQLLISIPYTNITDNGKHRKWLVLWEITSKKLLRLRVGYMRSLARADKCKGLKLKVLTENTLVEIISMNNYYLPLAISIHNLKPERTADFLMVVNYFTRLECTNKI